MGRKPREGSKSLLPASCLSFCLPFCISCFSKPCLTVKIEKPQIPGQRGTWAGPSSHPHPHPHFCVRFSGSLPLLRKSLRWGGGQGGACLRENRVIHTQGRGGVRNPRRRGRHPSLSAGLEASCLCNRPSHSPLSGNQGDLLRPSQQESKTNPTKRKKPPEARPASLRCPP